MQLKAPPKDALKGDQKALGNSSQGTLGTKTPMGEGDFLDVFNLPVKKPSAKKPPPLAHSPFRKGPSFDTSTRLFEKEKPEDTQNGKGEEKLSEIEAATDLSTLEKFVSSCKLCPLCESRKGQFFGRGKLGAKILFVSDPPSLISVKSNAYPGGEQGELLSKIIQGGLLLNEEDLYITPIVKCEIGAPDLINDLTLKICTKITLKEISIVSPTIVLALGQLAAQSLSGLPDPMDILRNKHKEYLSIGTQKIPLAMGFSLNYMLQEKDNKKRFFNDLQKIKKRLEQIIEEPK
jgi:DNA polymerase